LFAVWISVVDLDKEVGERARDLSQGGTGYDLSSEAAERDFAFPQFVKFGIYNFALIRKSRSWMIAATVTAARGA
jgi:hypothetical protein